MALDYYSGRPAPTIGNSRPVRLVAAVACLALLGLTAAGWFHDVRVDPYARTRDVVAWTVAAIVAGVVAAVIGLLGLSHWDDTNESPPGRENATDRATSRNLVS